MRRLQVALALGTVYLVWGSTYIAIRLGVAEMPWALMAGTRFTLGGVLFLGLLALLRRPLRPTRRDLLLSAAAGILLLGIGNGFLILAEATVPAGLAALVIAAIPVWTAAMEQFLPGGERLNRLGWLGLALGLVGLAVLLGPQLLRERGAAISPWGVVVLLLSSLSWALGTLLMRHRPVKLDAFATTGYQMVFGGLFSFALAFLLRQTWPTSYSPTLIGSIAYLIVFGSLISLSAFTWLTRNLAPAKLMTYAYVNPVVAVLLGALLLHETIDLPMVAGMIIIVLSVVIISRARLALKPKTPPTTELTAAPVPAATGD